VNTTAILLSNCLAAWTPRIWLRKALPIPAPALAPCGGDPGGYDGYGMWEFMLSYEDLIESRDDISI